MNEKEIIEHTLRNFRLFFALRRALEKEALVLLQGPKGTDTVGNVVKELIDMQMEALNVVKELINMQMEALIATYYPAA